LLKLSGGAGRGGVCSKPAGLIIVVVGSNRCAVDQLCVNRLVWRSAGEAGVCKKKACGLNYCSCGEQPLCCRLKWICKLFRNPMNVMNRETESR